MSTDNPAYRHLICPLGFLDCAGRTCNFPECPVHIHAWTRAGDDLDYVFWCPSCGEVDDG